MGTFFVHTIREQDHESFRRILGSDMPDTFEKWRYQRLKGALELSGPGQSVIEIEIYPEEFALFFNSTETGRNFDSLDRFARIKGRRDIP